MKKHGKYCYLFFLFFLFNFKIYSQSANFTVDTTAGCVPLTVEFTNLSTPSEGVTYFWDFGNGTTSTLKNPSSIYIQPGQYTISLTVSEGQNQNTIVKENFIHVYGNPTANFELSDNSVGCAPYSTSFLDLCTTPNDSIAMYLWDFGNGKYSEEIAPQNLYEDKGIFSVSLYIEDNRGCSDIHTKNNLVQVNKPNANFIADNNFSCDENMEVNFENLSDYEGTETFNWNFGDGSSSNDFNPIHIYDNVGVFDVQLVIVDNLGCTDTIIQNDYISNQHVKANFITHNKCPNTLFRLNNVSTNATEYLWKYPNGETDTKTNPYISFPEGGNYSINLIASNDYGCVDSFRNRISLEVIEANFEIDKSFSCHLPDTFNYVNLSNNATNYLWHFGNGNESFEENPSNIFEIGGVFSDTLFAISEHGCVDTFVVEEGIHVQAPGAYFTPNDWVDKYDLMGCVPNQVQLYDESHYVVECDSIVDWYWEFGDGATSNEQNPDHTYTTLGQFNIHLKITTAMGCIAEYGAWAATGTRQNASFNSNCPDTICASDSVQFINNSTDLDLVNLSLWNFGDSTTSTYNEPLHYFQDTGYMDIKLTVYNNGCPDDTIIENFIYVNGPYITIDPVFDCIDPYTHILQTIQLGVENFYWDFGDGSELDSLNLSPTHTYPNKGLFVASINSNNEDNGCSFSTNTLIQVFDPIANFSISDNKICIGDTAFFNSANSIDNSFILYNNNAYMYLWDFGDSTNMKGTNDTLISHIYEEEGDFEVKLIIKSQTGCYDTLLKVIHVHKPNPIITVDNVAGCAPMNVQFVSESSSYFPIESYLWNFGNDSISYEENPEFLFLSNGNFQVSLTLTDEQGCENTVTYLENIQVRKPNPQFICNKQNICQGDTSYFNLCNMNDTICEIIWDFGDGSFSSEFTPIHHYSNSGIYNVSLTLIDTLGCEATLTKENFVNVQSAPIANFSADTTNSNCYPLQVNFYDETAYNDNYTRIWQMSEIATSTLPNPTYIYTKPGDYSVSLTVTSENGCSNTLTQGNLISIDGPYGNLVVEDTVCQFIDYDYKIQNLENTHDIQWFFGEGSTSYDSIVQFSYNNIYTYYPVILLRSDSINTCNKLFFDTVTIRGIDAGFVFETGNQGCVPFDITMTDTTKNSFSRIWKFNNSFLDTEETLLFTSTQSGTYPVTMYETDIYGCMDTITKQVVVNPLPDITISADTFLCLGSELELWATGGENYQWYPSDYLSSSNLSNPKTNTTENIEYSVKGTDENGCTNTASTFIKVVVPPNPNVFDTTILVGDTAFIDFFQADIENYYLTTEINNICDTCSVFALNPIEETNYYLTVVDTAGCFEVTKNFTIDITLVYSIDVPTAFSPNGDGVNDVIFVDGWGIQELLYFNIYNRFGEKVYSSNDMYQGWDGTYKGTLQPVETYKYEAAVRSFDDNIRKKTGIIKLIY